MSEKSSRYKLILAGILAGVLASVIAAVAYNSQNATAQMMGHDMGGGSMGTMDHGSMGSMSTGSMTGMQHMPGMVQDMCHDAGDMAPQYCEPMYHVMTSVKEVKVSNVEPTGDRSVMVTLRETYAMSDGVTKRVVVVGGSGDLAGAVLVDAGWKGTNTVQLNLEGSGSVFDHQGMYVHVFPYTGS
jgi:hypothetical protein